MESNWDNAERFRQQHPDPEPHCPFCLETRMIELIDQAWVCYVCAKTWPDVTYNDKRLLRQLKIDPS